MDGNRSHVAKDLGVDEGGSRNKMYTQLSRNLLVKEKEQWWSERDIRLREGLHHIQPLGEAKDTSENSWEKR